MMKYMQWLHLRFVLLLVFLMLVRFRKGAGWKKSVGAVLKWRNDAKQHFSTSTSLRRLEQELETKSKPQEHSHNPSSWNVCKGHSLHIRQMIILTCLCFPHFFLFYKSEEVFKYIFTFSELSDIMVHLFMASSVFREQHPSGASWLFENFSTP